MIGEKISDVLNNLIVLKKENNNDYLNELLKVIIICNNPIDLYLLKHIITDNYTELLNDFELLLTFK